MLSCRNRKCHSDRPAARTSKRCSNPFEGAPISSIAGSPSAASDPRRAFESLAGSPGLLPPGLDVIALADLVALDDIGGLYLVPALGINLAILDTVAGVLIDLMEADLPALRRSRKEGDRT
jgi:hypothetical protein